MSRIAHATHLVFTGELTELGTPSSAWRKAIAGPLRPWARASATEAGKVVDLDDAVLLPVDVACHQPMGPRIRDLSRWERPVLLALHHPPLPHAWRAWQWVDGLRGHHRVIDWLARFHDTFVMHGHLHFAVEKGVGRDPRPRVFGVTATVDDAPDAPRVRIYEPSAGLASVVFEPWRAA